MSLDWVYSVGGTHEIFSEAVLLSQPQERMGWTRVVALEVIGIYL